MQRNDMASSPGMAGKPSSMNDPSLEPLLQGTRPISSASLRALLNALAMLVLRMLSEKLSMLQRHGRRRGICFIGGAGD